MTTFESQYYEAAQPGTATPSRIALTAEEHGYSGVVLRTPPTTHPQSVPDVGIDVVDGIELAPTTRAEASGAIGHYRSQCELLMVRGGSPTLNRYVLEEPKVDVLTAPFAEDGDLNHVLVRAAATNNVAIELRLEPVLRSQGSHRIRQLKRLRKAIELLLDADAPYVVSVAPTSHLELRSPRELTALGEILPLDGVAVESTELIADGLTQWGEIVERNRTRQSAAFIEPGIYHSDNSDS